MKKKNPKFYTINKIIFSKLDKVVVPKQLIYLRNVYQRQMANEIFYYYVNVAMIWTDAGLLNA